MIQVADLKPLQRQALLAMQASPTHTLHRAGGGYVAFGANFATSGTKQIPVFTGRLVNMLERDGLVDFDPPQFPARVCLTTTGLQLAEQLCACSAKAGAA